MVTITNQKPSQDPYTLSQTPNDQSVWRRGAIGVMARDNMLLMIRRAPDIVLGGHWCFPGGHIEAAETSRQAVVREFREELDIEIKPVCKLGYIRLPSAGYILAVWHVSFLSGAMIPAPKEISEIRWVSMDEVPAIEPGLPSNRIVFDMIKRAPLI